jgi:hypothetical protein
MQFCSILSIYWIASHFHQTGTKLSGPNKNFTRLGFLVHSTRFFWLMDRTIINYQGPSFELPCITLLWVELVSISVAKKNSELCSIITLHLNHIPSPRSSFGKVGMVQSRKAKGTGFRIKHICI